MIKHIGFAIKNNSGVISFEDSSYFVNRNLCKARTFTTSMVSFLDANCRKKAPHKMVRVLIDDEV